MNDQAPATLLFHDPTGMQRRTNRSAFVDELPGQFLQQGL